MEWLVFFQHFKTFCQLPSCIKRRDLWRREKKERRKEGGEEERGIKTRRRKKEDLGKEDKDEDSNKELH